MSELGGYLYRANELNKFTKASGTFIACYDIIQAKKIKFLTGEQILYVKYRNKTTY